MDARRLARALTLVHQGRAPTVDVQGLQFAIGPGVLLLSGSNSLWDWRHNLKAWPTQSPTGPGQVHAGWLDLARATLPEVLARRRGRFHTIAGYSLGAAVGLLLAEQLRDVRVVAFACPAVGNRAWAERYPHQVERFGLEPDWLTRPMLGRVHVGSLHAQPGKTNWLNNHIQTLAAYAHDRSNDRCNH